MKKEGTRKRKSLLVCVSMLCVALAAGTYAYLTDTDSDVNVMTLGGVEIDQIEQEWNSDKTALVDFTQGKPLYPYVGTLGWANKEADGGAYRQFTMANVVDKYVSVENTGKSDAYVRTVFAFEMGDYENVADFRNKVIGVSRNDVNGDEFKFSGAWVWGDPFVAQIDGKNYMIWEAVHQNAVAKGETTIPSLLQVYLNKAVSNEEVEAIDGNDNGTYDILVLSQAVQAEGFSDAQTALDTAFGKSADKASEWLASKAGADSEIDFTDAPEDAVAVEGADKAAVMAAIEKANSGDVVKLTENTTIAGYAATEKLVIEKGITLDLNGYTLTTECGWGGIDLKDGASLVNGTINHTGNTAAIKAFNVGRIENVVINVTETDGKTKGGIVVQETGGSYVGAIKNVVIKGATNGIEAYNCGGYGHAVIGSVENVTINATDTGLLLSAPIGEVKNCTIEGEKIGVNAYLKGAYNVAASFINCKISGANADIYAHDEVGLTNPGSMSLAYDAATALSLDVAQEFEAEVADRVFVGVK